MLSNVLSDITLTRICMLFITCMQPFAVYADSKERALSSLVMLTSNENNYSSGLIVGENDSWIYIATAASSLFGNQNGSQKVFAEFYQLPGATFKIQTEHVDIDNDFAVAKVDKKQASTIVIPSLSRAYVSETHNKLQLVGRKSLQQLWRLSPFFEVLDMNHLDSTQKSHITLKSFFELPGFYGGGVFDKDWRLVGMAIKSTTSTQGYAADELTDTIPIAWIVDKLTHLSIPKAEYLVYKQGSPLAEKLALYQMLRLRSTLFSDDLGGNLSLLFRVFRGQTVEAAKVYVYVKNSQEQWFLSGEKILGDDIFHAEASFIIPKSSTKVVVCYSNKLKSGGFAVGLHQTNKLDFFSNDYAPSGEFVEFRTLEPLHYTIKNPCAVAVKKIGVDIKSEEAVKQGIVNEDSIDEKSIPPIVKKLYLGAYVKGLPPRPQKTRMEHNRARVKVKIRSTSRRLMREKDYNTFINVAGQDTLIKLFSAGDDHSSQTRGFFSGLSVGDVKKLSICHAWNYDGKWISVKNSYVSSSPEALKERKRSLPMLVHKIFTPDTSSFIIRSANSIEQACDISGRRVVMFERDKKRERTKAEREARSKASKNPEELLEKVCAQETPLCKNLRETFRHLPKQ